MHRTETKTRNTFGYAALFAAMTLAGNACVMEDELMIGSTETFEEFEATVYQEPESGVYIVDGDTPVADIDELREFYEMHVRDGALIVHQAGGADVKWDDTQKLNITYCVSKSGFGSYYNTVVQDMNSATGAWESAADVNFVHLSAEDGNCTARNGNVVFDVRPTSSGQYLARAFFPNSSRSQRNILIDWSSFNTSAPLTLTGILRHELGHTLGFRHEHTRPESGVCFEDTSWRSLTPYDSGSVMHYPQCNGTGNWSLTLTNYDKQGAAALYNTSGGGGGGGGCKGKKCN